MSIKHLADVLWSSEVVVVFPVVEDISFCLGDFDGLEVCFWTLHVRGDRAKDIIKGNAGNLDYLVSKSKTFYAHDQAARVSIFSEAVESAKQYALKNNLNYLALPFYCQLNGMSHIDSESL